MGFDRQNVSDDIVRFFLIICSESFDQFLNHGVTVKEGMLKISLSGTYVKIHVHKV